MFFSLDEHLIIGLKLHMRNGSAILGQPISSKLINLRSCLNILIEITVSEDHIIRNIIIVHR